MVGNTSRLAKLAEMMVPPLINPGVGHPPLYRCQFVLIQRLFMFVLVVVQGLCTEA